MKVRYNKILVPVDGSDHALLACRHAAGIAVAANAELILLHCYGDLPSVIGGEAREETIKACEEEGRALMLPCIALCEEQKVLFTPLVKPGSPERTIISVCETHKCDLIVMGSRGLNDFAGMVMGSVSHRVLAHATVPVLIVR